MSRRKRGGQPNNTNALKHGVYAAPPKPLATLPDVIADLQARIGQLAGILDAEREELTKQELVDLMTLYGQLVSRLGRLLRDNRALTGKAADGIAAAIAAAIDEFTTETGASVEV